MSNTWQWTGENDGKFLDARTDMWDPCTMYKTVDFKWGAAEHDAPRVSNDNLIVKALIEENDFLRRRMWRNFVAGTLMGAIAMIAMFVLTGQ
jgi:hypothetical protein